MNVPAGVLAACAREGFPCGDENADALAGALAELRAPGVPVGTVSENARERYAHVRAPDGQVYEPVERRPRG
ncbi:hypothetical protein [Kitasatospora sp. DSM 101779]|uniref:hypothetical protein n=1 Tax=Kitasatospora sp. DSM 101779 TaxID=2853165 RepID=UPI0021D9ABB8|nr:hypothetical protein [Kitasatospora sp. DSM 101779]MCU7826660.1 hypothetical protein [Kitasatospora sp. DSM 101779]